MRSKKTFHGPVTHLTLYEGTHPAFLVSDSLDVHNLGVLREMLREQVGEIFLIDI